MVVAVTPDIERVPGALRSLWSCLPVAFRPQQVIQPSQRLPRPLHRLTGAAQFLIGFARERGRLGLLLRADPSLAALRELPFHALTPLRHADEIRTFALKLRFTPAASGRIVSMATLSGERQRWRTGFNQV